MRKVLTRLLVAAAVASGLLSAGGSPSGADPIRELLVDLSVSAVSLPGTVSPAGAPAVYAITVTNTGALPTTSATLTVGLPGDAAFAGGECTPTCVVGPLNAGESQQFETIANTPTTPSTGDGYATTATVSDVNAIGLDGGEVLEAIENTDNNTATALTQVLDDPNSKSGFLAENESMALSLADGRDFLLRVPSGVPGVIVRYLKASDRLYTCGAFGPCEDGFALDFVPHPVYQAVDPNNALIFRMDFGPSTPCRGIGAGSSCPPDVYTGITVDQPTLIQAPYCEGAAPGAAAAGNGRMQPVAGYYYACVNDETKSGDTFYFDGRMRSVDPPLIPSLGF